mgnify:FL=1
MKIDLWHHLDASVQAQINEALTLLRGLFKGQVKIMAAIDDLRAANAAAQTSIDGIAGDIQTLKDLLAAAGSSGMNAADTAEALALATGLASRLSALDLENPTP